MIRTILARLPFTFLLLGAFFGYEAYNMNKGLRGPVSQNKIIAFAALSVVMILISIAAFRERHRPRVEQKDDLPSDLIRRR